MNYLWTGAGLLPSTVSPKHENLVWKRLVNKTCWLISTICEVAVHEKEALNERIASNIYNIFKHICSISRVFWKFLFFDISRFSFDMLHHLRLVVNIPSFSLLAPSFQWVFSLSDLHLSNHIPTISPGVVPTFFLNEQLKQYITFFFGGGNFPPPPPHLQTNLYENSRQISATLLPTSSGSGICPTPSRRGVQVCRGGSNLWIDVIEAPGWVEFGALRWWASRVVKKWGWAAYGG